MGTYVLRVRLMLFVDFVSVYFKEPLTHLKVEHNSIGFFAEDTGCVFGWMMEEIHIR